ncbi:MAG TPA: hypothetical protein VK671_14755 [Mucilaginibacter sp.]|jgi:hypothetical protein|nr:hypothetical protein [Mucilaginibacter sp.]
MNTEKDDNLDKLFKMGLEDPVDETAFREADWDAMEQMLDKSKKRSAIVYWLPIVGSAAALVIIFLGYLFLKTDVVKPGKKDQVAANHPTNGKTIDKVKSNTGTSGEPARQAADSGKQQTKSAQYAITTPARRGRAGNGGTFFSLSAGKGRRGVTGNINKSNDQQPVLANNVVPNTANGKTQSGVVDANVTQKTDVIANNNKPAATSDKTQSGAVDSKADQKDNVLANSKTVTPGDKTQLGTADANANKSGTIAANSTTIKSTLRQKPGNRPVFALGIIASSDLNGVNSSFQQSKVGGNFGATFSVTFGKKWTISTGAQYDIKPYLTNFDNYHTSYPFKTQPTSVNADCRMLDIPLNINYQVYHQKANSITVGTGLSSYFMLREDYQFNYADPYATGPAHYTVINKNRNILSVLNFDATYTHQINSKFGVTVQPYTKVPLSDVGYSQVRLQSTGVAFGINWNINASSKPK